jgi:hypothetical protein
MGVEDLQDLVIRQIEAATFQIDAQRSRGENPAATRALVKSLRLSLAAFMSGIDPDCGADDAFVLQVAADGEVQLRRNAQAVSIGGTYFDSLQRRSGIELAQGQLLLVEPEFALRALEESLGETAAAKSALEKRRSEIVTALGQSAGQWREELQQELARLDAKGAELLLRRIELSNLNQVAATVRSSEAAA